MAVKFDWAKYRTKHSKLPDVKEQWRRVINSEKGVVREAIHANKVKQAQIKGQKEGLRIIGEEVAPFARYVIRNPKGDLVGIVNDQAQLEEQLKNLNITPNAFDPMGFNAQGKQVIGKYRIYDNAIRGEERKILEIAHPKAVPLHKRINVPLLINDLQDAETETRASSVPIPRDDIESLDEEIEEKEKEIKKKEEEKKVDGVEIKFGTFRGGSMNADGKRLVKGTEFANVPGYPDFFIVYDGGKGEKRRFSVVHGLTFGGGVYSYGPTPQEAVNRARSDLDRYYTYGKGKGKK